MPDIFVSYERSTVDEARAIAAELRSVGYDVWNDDQLPVHRVYSEVIEEHLRAARVVLVIWSAEAVRSKWVRAEADMALKTDKLVQLTLDGTLPPLPFNQIDCADLAGWTGDPTSHGWRKVLASIEQLTKEADSKHRPELRHLTLLSCGLVQATDDALTPDPEDWHNIATRYRDKAGEAVRQFGGYVAKTMGNNVVAYFGFPIAQEGAASRAALAGFAIIDATRELNRELASEHTIRLSAQVGIHAGTVVVSLDGNDEILGDMPDIAAQVQRSATPDSVMITSTVCDLLDGSFQVEPYAVETSNWIDKPIELYRIISPVRLGKRSKGFTRRELSPFVGRQDELQLLTSRWSRVREGNGQMVLLVGEPGIGKTRLTEEFATQIQGDAHIWLQSGGDQFRTNSPFHAVTQLVEQAMDAGPDETNEQLLARLENVLAPSGADLADAVPLIAEMLKLDFATRYLRSALSPDLQRRKVLEILTAWLLCETSIVPLVLVIEDLHWLDPSTLELVQILVEQGSTAPLFLLCTTRAEFRPPWFMRAHHAQIPLDRLNNSHTQALVESMGNGVRVDSTVATVVVERSGGVPLFAEELARLVIDRGGRVGAHEVPLTLQDSLAARLDRLGPARQIAQLGAVIGRSFSYELILAVSQIREADVRSALTALADAELVHVRGHVPNAHYEFKHGLVQDAAYKALLSSQRRELHTRVAETILIRDPTLASEHPEILANHWSEAGETEKAISAWTRAGKQATSRFAYKEAAESFRQALTLLDKLTETPSREDTALKLQSFLVGALQITCGYSADETKAATRVARQHAEKRGDIETQFKHTNGEWMAASSAGDYPTSGQHADKLLSLAQAIAKPRELATAYMALVTTRLRTGDLVQAEQFFVSGERYFTSEEFLRRQGTTAQTYGNGAINALIMGNEAEAKRRIQVVHDRIRTSEDPYELAFSLHMSGLLDLMLGELESAEQRAIDCIERSTEGGYPQFAATSSIVLGRSRAEMGRAEEGLRLINEGLTHLRETGNRAAITHYLNWFAETYAQCDSLDLALQTIDEALTVNPNEINYRAESLRIRAELRFARGDEDRAQVDLRDAINLAESIGARLYWQRAMEVLSSHGGASAISPAELNTIT